MVVAGSPSAVYQAMIEPEAVVVWLPPEGMTGEGLNTTLSQLARFVES